MPLDARRAAAAATATAVTALFAALAAAPPARAQEPAPPPELVTDRPDQTESAEVVPPGYLQLETGVERVEEGGVPEVESAAIGSSLLRVGLVEGLELRLGWGGWVREEEEGGPEIDGAADAEVGLKVALWEPRGARPRAALLAGVSVPAGERGLSTERWDPALRLSFAHDLPRGVGLGYNLGMAWESDPGDGADGAGGGETASRLEYTVAAGFGLGPRLGAFVELFGDAPVDAPPGSDAGPAHSADAGLTFLVSPRLQLDLAAGAGLSDHAPDRFVLAGVSVRWPR